MQLRHEKRAQTAQPHDTVYEQGSRPSEAGA